jgi:hypothetical protein
MKKISVFSITFFILSTFCIKTVKATTYYITPSGNDANTGLSESEPWATFDRAVNNTSTSRSQIPGQRLQPGDTLILMDGIYRRSFRPQYTEGLPEAPITVRAQHDGLAILDGEGTRVPFTLDNWSGDEYFIIEGLVARNSSASVYVLSAAHNNIFRRVSGYNAEKDGNNMVFSLGTNTHDNLLEDCVAAGTGRKMILNHRATTNTIRRCFADWHRWDGIGWHDQWPWGENIDIYNSSNILIENSIGFGRVPRYSFTVRANCSTCVADNNRTLGSVAVNTGRYPNGTFVDWSTPPDGKTEFLDVYTQPSYRAGFEVFGWSGGTITNTLYQDILAVNNTGHGFFHYYNGLPIPANTSVNRATIIHNGLDARQIAGGLGTGAFYDPGHGQDISQFTITDSHITGLKTWSSVPQPDIEGDGAQITKRYFDGQLTNQNLWPWPMEDRIKTEYSREFGAHNFSVTCEIGKLINQYTNHPITNINVDDYCSGVPITTPTIAINPTQTPTSTQTPSKPGDANGDNKVDGVDYVVWLNNYNTSNSGPSNGDFNNNNKVDGVDYVVWLNNYGT